LQVIAGADREDPASSGKSFYFAPQYARALKDIVLGYSPADFADAPAAELRPAVQKAFEDIKALGVQLKEVTMPEFPYGALVSTIIRGEAGSIFEELITSGKVDELADQKQIAALKASLDLPAKDYLRAMRVRTLVQQAFDQLFGQVDVLLSPTMMTIAPKISDPLDRPSGARPQGGARGLAGLIPAGNLAGLPGLSMPCGFAEGMPVGISVVGRPFSEMMLLTIGREYQARTDHHRKHPTVA
jgi:aspartyl-tRNA(Asn)/glutamyl-tRNA(Gln) amidotransferase subunit A